MQNPLRGIGALVSGATLAIMLGSCGGGSDSSSLLHFGINGEGRCERVSITIDLESARAALDVDQDDLGCARSALAVDEDCEIRFSEIDEGKRFRAVIDGCTLDAVASLFHCQFDHVDLSRIRGEVTATCDCASSPCDGQPPVCVGDHEDPGACEHCSNGVDDDANGLEDCADPNCEHIAPCPAETTTTSTTSTTSTSSTTTTSVSTTTIPVSQTFAVRFELQESQTLGSLRWDIRYGALTTRVRRDVGNPRCTGLVQGAQADFDYDTAQRVIHATMTSEGGFAGPLDLVECRFDGDAVPAEDDFALEILEALDPELIPIDFPFIFVDGVFLLTTTTTVFDGTTSTTTTTIPSEPYQMTIRLTSTSAPLGSLQLAINYSAADGRIQGHGSRPDCEWLVPNYLFAFNDIDEQRTLNVGAITIATQATLVAPRDIVQCTFIGNPSDPPLPSAFSVTVVEATTGFGAPVVVAGVIRIEPL